MSTVSNVTVTFPRSGLCIGGGVIVDAMLIAGLGWRYISY